MIRRSLVLSVLLIVAPALRAADDLPRTYESAEHGFRLKHPAGWNPNRRKGPGGTWIVQFNDAVSGVLVEVRRPGTPREPEAIRDDRLRKVLGAAGYENARGVAGRIAGREAPGLEVGLTQGGRKWRLRQLYLVHAGNEITFQTFALAASFEGRTPLFDRMRKSFALVPVTAESRERTLLRRLAARCGTDIDWAETWAEAARRAREQHKPVLVYVRSLGGFTITDAAMAGLFMDEDVEALIRDRLVPHRLPAGSKAPFVSPEVYGLSRTTFGSALLVVSPEGRVLAETFTLEPMSAFVFLRDALKIRPDPEAEAALEKRGDFLALARISARRRDGEAALAWLDEAQKSGQDAGEIHYRRGLVLTRMGRFSEGKQELSRVAKASPRRPDAQLLFVSHWLRANRTAAVKTARDLIRDHPESRAARRAAAALLGTGFETGARGRLRWPTGGYIDAVRPPVPERVGIRQARRARREALAVVLDRHWISPVLIGRAEDDRPHAFTLATRALCAASLIPVCDSPRVRREIREAIAQLDLVQRDRHLDPPPVHFMDYSVWALTTHLRLLAQATATGILDAKDAYSTATLIVVDLAERQRPGGGFSYYVTRDLERKAKDTQSISFVTAYAALALLDARDAGLPVPPLLLDRVLDGLAAMRNPNGTFSYMKPPGVKTPDGTREPGAAGRGPLCALALQRGGRADLDLVRKTLAIFARHRGELGAQRRKALMHTGTDGQGSHYLMFDYATIAEAVAALPEAERGAYRKILLEEILACRLADGSYLDNPFLGRALGSALALTAFECLSVPR